MEATLNKIQEQLKQEIIKLLRLVVPPNHDPNKYYDLLIEIVLNYKEKLTHNEALQVFKHLEHLDGWNMFQEEVLFEVGNRLSGFCSQKKEIIW